MTIIRAPRPESNWYQLDKRISEDRRLSWAARGLLIFLLGKPDHWRVSVQALVNETASASLSSGRDAVYRILRELQSAGYLVRSQSTEGHGKFGEVDYLVSEMPVSPLTENPEAAPLTGLPLTAQPHTANPTLVNTEDAVSTEVQQKQKPRAVRFDARAHLVSVGIDAQIVDDWLTLRRAKRLPLTLTAWTAVEGEAAKCGMTPAAAVKLAVQSGWAGFRAKWVHEQGVGSPAVPAKALPGETMAVYQTRIHAAPSGQPAPAPHTPLPVADRAPAGGSEASRAAIVESREALKSKVVCRRAA